MSVASDIAVAQLSTHLNAVLTNVNAALQGNLNNPLPLAGNLVAAGSASVSFVTTLQTALINNGLNSLTASSTTETQIESTLNNALVTAGLPEVRVEATITTNDIVTLRVVGTRAYNNSITLGNMGLGNMGIKVNGTGNLSVGYGVDFTVGLDATGAFFDTVSSREIFADIGVTTPNLDVDGTMGLLNFGVRDIAATPSNFAAQLGLNITDVNGDGLIRPNEIGTFSLSNITSTLNGLADINLSLDSSLANGALPGVSGDLHVDWNFQNSIISNTGLTSIGSRPTVVIDNVQIDLGRVVDDFVAPTLLAVDPFLKPFDQVGDLLRAPIAALEQFGDPAFAILDKTGGGLLADKPDGKITLLDFFELVKPGFNTYEVNNLFAFINQLRDWNEFLQSNPFDGLGAQKFDIGSFSFGAADIRAAGFDLTALNPTIIQAGTSIDTAVQNLVASAQTQNLGNFLTAFIGGTVGVGGATVGNPQFQLLSNPMTAFQLFTGGATDLFSMDLPRIELPTLSVPLANIPIFNAGFATVNVLAELSAKLGIDVAFGLDTRGLRQFAAGGYANPSLLLNGLFADDQIVNNKDNPELDFSVKLEGGLKLDAIIASLGGSLDVTGKFLLDLLDPTPGDGRIYYDEFSSSAQSNPLSLFNAYGQATAGAGLYASFLGATKRWDSERLILADLTFSGNGAQGESGTLPELGIINSAGLLTLNTGSRANLRNIDQKSDVAEKVNFAAGLGNNVRVGLFSFSENFKNTKTIFGSLGVGDDEISVVGDRTKFTRIMNLKGDAGMDRLVAGAGADTLDGGADSDMLDGGAGNDRLLGGDGNDRLTGGSGADRVDGGAGDDSFYYTASVSVNLATGVGTNEAAGDILVGIEFLEGSIQADTLIGDDSVNNFWGNDGADSIAGAGGNDILSGGVGADMIDGGAGFDISHYFTDTRGVSVDLQLGTSRGGSALGDLLVGIEGLVGGSGNDTFGGDAAKNRLDGGPGGNDSLRGLNGDDTLLGGVGSDTMQGDAGVDLMVGGAGDDLYLLVSSGDTNDEVVEILDEGADTVESAINHILAANVEILTLTGNENINGGGNAIANVISGNSGDNVIQGFAAPDILDGGAGFDTLSYADAPMGVTVNMETGSGSAGDATGDTISNFEFLLGSTGQDRLTGDARDNSINPNRGKDTVNGGNGIDTLEIDFSKYGATTGVQYASSGGNGIYSLKIGGGVAAGTTFSNFEIYDLTGTKFGDSLRGGALSDTIIGGAGADSIDGGGGLEDHALFTTTVSVNQTTGVHSGEALGDKIKGIEVFVFAGGNDTFTGDSLGQTAVGNSGVDRLSGMAGNDTLAGGAGADVLNGGNGNDFLDYSTSPASVNVNLLTNKVSGGHAAGDTISQFESVLGSSNTDTLTGGKTANALRGMDGSDRLDGGAGIDTLTGGLGNDTSVADESKDLVVENMNEGNDLVLASADYTLSENVERLTLTGTRALNGIGNSGDNTLTGNIAGNLLAGLGGSDDLLGGKGFDIADYSASPQGVNVDLGAGTANGGHAAGDFLSSIEGIYGSRFNDTLIGDEVGNLARVGRGGDVVILGEGDDVLVLDYSENTFAGNATYAAGLVFDSFAGFSGDGFNYFNGGTDGYGLAYKNSAGAFDRVDFKGVDRSNITGTPFNDSIVTGLGSDTLIGGAGNDTLHAGYTIRNNFNAVSEHFDGGSGFDIAQGANLSALNGRVFDNTSKNVNYGGATFIDIEAFQTIALSAANDRVLTPGNGDDSFYTGDGNDTVNLGLGSDVAVLEGGDDVLILDYSKNTFAGNETYAAGLIFNAFAGFSGDGFNYSTAGFDGYGLAYKDKNGGFDRIDFKSVERSNITGTRFNDSIRTGPGSDTLIGGSGDDTLNAGNYAAASEDFDGGSGFDIAQNANLSQLAGRVFDNTSKNVNYGGATFVGIEAFQTIGLSAANDTVITPGIANDTFYTGEGNDTVNLGQGEDIAVLEGGEDILVLDYSGNTFAGNETFAAGLTFNAFAGFRFDGGNYSTAGFDGFGLAYKTGEGGLDRVDFKGVERSNVTGTSFNDVVTTANGMDTLIGGAGNDTLNATGSNDLLQGGAGNDSLIGGSGNDTLQGGGGKNEIDILIGGSEADLFQLGQKGKRFYDDGLTSSTGTKDYVLIADFNVNEDRLQLAGFKAQYALGISGISGETGLGLFFIQNGAKDELIAVLRSSDGTTLTDANTINTGLFMG